VITAPRRATTSTEPVPPAFRRSSVFAVIDVAADGQVLGANRAALEFLGYSLQEELRGKNVRADLLADPADWAHWERAATSSESRDIELEFVSGGSRRVVLRGSVEKIDAGSPTKGYFRAILVDGTAERQLQQLSHKAARMEAMFGLCAGVSHDFNNLLTVLVGNLYLISESVRDNVALFEKVKRARETAKRGSDFARRLLTLARGAKAEEQREAISAEKVLTTIAPLLSSALGGKVTLNQNVGPSLPAIRVDRAQLESVITNLVINARDAVAEKANGTVTIDLTRRELNAAEATRAGTAAGVYVELAVRDDGCGIPDAVAQRVFEPFFTTKPNGKGSGLGLPMVRWFAEEAGGTVLLKSRPNEGTEIRVLLPAQAHQASDIAETHTGTMPLSALPGGDESVVVWSEDADLRTMIQQILSTLGYNSLAANTAGVAKIIADSAAAVLVIDTSSLTIGANDVAAFLRRHPGAGVVIVGDRPLEVDRPIVRVPKPFTLPELTHAVRKSLEKG
jgi:two-component system, cell cycle sensor histidine kinase and response regulator CckA